MDKPKVLFLCVHNSCRSHIAEALMDLRGGYLVEAYSAGTERAVAIDPGAIRMMKELYDIDLEKKHYIKTIEEIPPVDKIMVMDCNAEIPNLSYEYECLDWCVEDPYGKSDEVYERVISEIDEKVKDFVLKGIR